MSYSIFNVQSIALKIACSMILGLLWILLGNADFVILLKAQITRKKINLPNLFFVNWVAAGTSNSLQYLIWLTLSLPIFW